MPKVNYTRTVNPLQFDALEPKRFEDLVRQLLHDFRPWRQLEATGRSGSDDGFDVRGWESSGGIADAETESEEDLASISAGDRIWLVQCKRERTIGPTKLINYLNDISDDDVKTLHGIAFVACADFSKKARDDFRSWCVEHGVAEFHLWGKAELEDALFQPKNDGLLFAYFGLSLTIRRRSEQARLRAQTTVKRKLSTAIEKAHHFLLRDAADDKYPYRPKRDEDFGWWVYSRPKLTFRGLEVVVRRYFAFIDDDGKHWDYANAHNDGRLDARLDPWRGGEVQWEQRQTLYDFWSAFPRQNQAWLEVWGVMPFLSVIEVDELGDDITGHPHIFVIPHAGISRPFEHDYAELESLGRRTVNPRPSTRIEKFPAEFRKPLPFRVNEENDSD
ncbi:restriction endonuclease [Rhizobium leguminosarum]|uniref:restriction endonuclease n=1 Tax=Rhizobium leguminosarum TaxID=384 RepID=UPI003F96DCFE